jgi:diacylglycerol kinase (ATP)
MISVISPYQKISLIYNPFAGGLRNGGMARLERARAILQTRSRDVSRYETVGPKTAGEIARECIAGGADLIVAAGGDGTINEVVEGMTGSQVPLAILPAGTANVLANEIGLGGRMEQAAEKLPQCVVRRVPVGRLTMEGSAKPHQFLMMAGAGLDAHIVFHLDPVLKAKFGKLAYWAGGGKQFLRRLEEFEVEVNGQKHLSSFALISKVRNYGGDFEIASQVRLEDEEFEVVLFEGPNPWRYLIYLAGVAIKQAARLPGVRVYRANEITMRPLMGDDVHLQVDGEYAGRLPAHVTVVRDSLSLLVPPAYGRK